METKNWKRTAFVLNPARGPLTQEQSLSFRQRLWDIVIQNIDRYLEGGILFNELTNEQLQGI